jgi:hypothetical protein
MALSGSRASCPTTPHWRDKSILYISLNELHEKMMDRVSAMRSTLSSQALTEKKSHETCACIVPKKWQFIASQVGVR